MLIVGDEGRCPDKSATLKGCVPFTPMPYEPALEVAALSMKEWMRRKSLGATNEYKPMGMSI